MPKSFADSFGNFNYNIFTILTEVFINNPQDIEKYIPTDERIDYLIANRKRLLILLRYSKGTIYENLKEKMIENIIQCQSVFLQKSDLLDNCNIGKKFKIIRMVFENILNMLLDSLEDDIGVEERRYIIKFSYEYNLCGFKRLVKEYVK
ncbi:TetR/AcrR family transcriptional regulator [Clostridium sp. JN-1]|uniref:TetR/AcrR family transcriptional regulator n=1 Tax=Clostridium sp. JN-1 TaxID=2483110 RepID=UPI000F0BD739|nr:TetR/AcrR family transcriptional regulator [Clostridium sp. JN-1]